MATRTEHIVRPVPDAHRHLDPCEVEAPGASHRQDVVDPAIDAAQIRQVRALAMTRLQQPTAQGGEVGRGQLVVRRDLQLPRLDRDNRLSGESFDQGTVGHLPQAGLRELLDVARRHAREPVEPLGIEGGGADDGGAATHPVGQQRRAGKGVGRPARTPPGREAVPPERIRQACHVLDHVDDSPAPLAARPPIAGTIGDQEADTAPHSGANGLGREQADPGCAVVEDHRHALVGTVQAVRECPAVTQQQLEGRRLKRRSRFFLALHQTRPSTTCP
jgi:hypothetical protein